MNDGAVIVPRIIVEGGNLSGKTSIANILEKRFVHSVAVAIHGYYHPRFLEVVKSPGQAIDYHQQRLMSFLHVFGAVSAEEIVFNRFHITASVYLQIFYGVNHQFSAIEQELDRLGVFLVLADFDDNVLQRRLQERKSSGKEPPWGDNDFAKAGWKRDLYRHFFRVSGMKRKILVDTSNISADEAVARIVQEIQASASSVREMEVR